MTSLLDITSGIGDNDDLFVSANIDLGGGLSSLPPAVDAVSCLAHEGEQVKLFCETCGEAICFLCAISEGKHHSHSYVPLSKAYSKYQDKLEGLLKSFTDGLDNVSGILGQVDAACVGLKEKEGSIEEDILHAFQELHDVLSERQTELLCGLKEATHGKVKVLSSRKDELEVVQTKVGRSADVLRSNLASGGVARMLKLKKDMEKQVGELSILLQHSSRYTETGKLEFQRSEDAAKACREFGKLRLSEGPDPEKCYVSVTASGLHKTQVGVDSIVMLFVLNCYGEPLEMDVTSSCTADLLPEEGETSTLTAVKGAVKKIGLNEYEISYRPCVSGSYGMHVKLLDQHVQGSPVRVEVCGSSKSESVGGALSLVEMKGILAVAVSWTGDDLVVTRATRPCITVFNSSGQEVCSFGLPGFGKGCLNNPRGVAVSDHGEIAVADMYNNRIQFFSLKGEFIAVVGGKHSGPLTFDRPQSVAFNTVNKRWYVLDNRGIHVLKQNLEFVRSFGQNPKKKEALQSPRGLACDSKGMVFVADTGNNCIKAFTPEGSLLSFGSKGFVERPLSEPMALGCGNASLYVCEKKNSRISVYKGTGKFVTFLKDNDSAGALKFQALQGVAVDSCGNCYICDSTGVRKLSKSL